MHDITPSTHISPGTFERGRKMEYISSRIAVVIANALNREEKWQRIYQYAIQILLEKWISLSVIGVIAFLLHQGMEYLFFLLIFMPLRSHGGGFHMKTYPGCLLGSIILIIGTLFAAEYLPLKDLPVFCVVSDFAMLCAIRRMAPVQHINRPMTEKEIAGCRKRIRTVTVVIAVLLIALMLAGCLKYLSIASVTLFAVVLLMIAGRWDYRKQTAFLSADYE